MCQHLSPKISARAGGTVDLLKLFPSSTLIIIMQNLVADSHTMCMHVGLKNFGNSTAPTLGTGGGVADPRKYALSTCVIMPDLVIISQTIQA